MTFIPDLSPCTYFWATPELLAVGWLDAPHAYPTGPRPDGFIDALGHLLRDPWNPFSFMGSHTCTLCAVGKWWWLPPEHNDLELGQRNLWIPADGKLYVAPSLIIHYVHDHEYLPPEEFVEAVLQCPPMGSDEYFAAVSRVAPRQLREHLP